MRSLILGAALAAAAAAQPYGTDVICTTTSQVVYRINAAGGVTTIVGSTGGQFANMVAMDNDNRNLAVLLFSPPSIVIVDPVLGGIVGTVWTGPPILTADYFNPLHTGDFFIAGTGTDNLKSLFLVRRDGSGATVLASGAPFANLQGAIQDLATGNLAAGDITANCIFNVTLGGIVVNTWVPGQVGPFSMTQDHQSGDLILGQGANSARGVYRFSHATSAVTTVAPQSVVGNSNAICFDRAPGSGEIVVGTSPVRRIDLAGMVHAVWSGVPATNTGMCFYQERNLVSVRVA